MRIVAITEQGATVRAEGKFLVVEQSGTAIRKLRTAHLDQLVLLGQVELTSGAIALLARSEIDTVFLTSKGTFRARLLTRGSKNIVLRCRQWERAADPDFALRFVRGVVAAKIVQQRQILLRAQRDLKDETLAETLARMRVLVDQSRRADSVASLRGYEGAAAAAYFGQFGKLIRHETFEFHGRNRRPPRDPVNAVLSFCYALMLSQVETEVYRCGLDPFRGFFHEPAHGRPSLVLDLLEEFRPLIDQLVLRLFNRRQLGPGDFDFVSGRAFEAILADTERGDDDEPDAVPEEPPPAGSAGVPFDPDPLPRRAVYLGETGRKIVLAEFYKRLRERSLYGSRSQTLELKQIVREQCYHLARVIEGEEEAYCPFAPR